MYLCQYGRFTSFGTRETHLQQGNEESIKIPEQKLLDELPPLQRVRHGDPRLLERSRGMRHQPFAVCSAKALEDVVHRRRLVSSSRDHMSDICVCVDVGQAADQNRTDPGEGQGVRRMTTSKLWSLPQNAFGTMALVTTTA